MITIEQYIKHIDNLKEMGCYLRTFVSYNTKMAAFLV